MHSRCSKTEAGRAEIRNKALPLSRTARNLLLIIDGSRPLSEWLALVHGATEADVEGLIAQGLIEPAAAQAGSSGASSRSASREPTHESLTAAINALGYDQLYTLLTSQAKERLGLIKGYRFVLDVERCTNLTELQAVAQRFIETLTQEHGEAGMRYMRQALGLQT
jgi:hypothetical protein